MSKHRNPRPKVPKQPIPDNPDPGVLITRLYSDLVELEGLAVTADECVTALPVSPTGKYKRTIKRLYVLVGATAGRASEVLEWSEGMLTQLAAPRGGRRSLHRRAR